MQVKNDFLTSELKELKSKIGGYQQEKLTLKNQLEKRDKESKHQEEKLTRDRDFWRCKAEKLQAEKERIIRNDPCKICVERLIMNERDNDMRIKGIYEDLEKTCGIDRVNKLIEVGSTSTEITPDVRMNHIDMFKFANRRIKDIPLYNYDLSEKRMLDSGRIGKDGLYDEKDASSGLPISRVPRK